MRLYAARLKITAMAGGLVALHRASLPKDLIPCRSRERKLRDHVHPAEAARRLLSLPTFVFSRRPVVIPAMGFYPGRAKIWPIVITSLSARLDSDRADFV